ncbi:MAG: AMP-binding protein [Gammaproteobacteria bacterium]|nr:AMP-binding protein [Gammaproteobacteria bacterium]
MNDYASTRRDYRWDCPARFNFARDVIDRWAAADPAQPAMLWVDDHGHEERRSFAEIAAASRRAANVLAAAGVVPGDRLVLLLGRQIAWWEVLTACLRMGAVASPGTAQLSAKDLAFRINAAQATCVVTDTGNAAKVDAVLGECPSLKARVLVDGSRDGWIDYAAALRAASEAFITVDTAADDEALCYFTSGTTGQPKMCMHAHSYGLAHQTTGRYWLDLKPSDLHWNLSDTGWAKAAWSSYFGPWNCGAAIFVHHTQGFSARRALELLAAQPITTFCGAPTIYRMFVQEDLARYRFPRLRHCVGAGEPLNPEVIETWRKATGLVIRDGYGQTETVILCGNYPSLEPRFGSMGKPAPGIELAVIDAEGRVLPPATEGDVAVRVKPERPPGLFLGYKGDPKKTASSFRGDWYLTGDRATVDADGYFWFVGRADDVILSAGYRIGPFEVESALIEHPAVAESAVVSSPDDQRGEIVKAFVVLAPGHEASEALAAELQAHVKQVTAPYKYPRRIEFVEELPKTVSGKIRRVELRNREWGR